MLHFRYIVIGPVTAQYRCVCRVVSKILFNKYEALTYNTLTRENDNRPRLLIKYQSLIGQFPYDVIFCYWLLNIIPCQ